jgi:hypothetical protein
LSRGDEVVGALRRKLHCDGAEIDADQPCRQGASQPESGTAASATKVDKLLSWSQPERRHGVAEQPPRT